MIRCGGRDQMYLTYVSAERGEGSLPSPWITLSSSPPGRPALNPLSLGNALPHKFMGKNVTTAMSGGDEGRRKCKEKVLLQKISFGSWAYKILSIFLAVCFSYPTLLYCRSGGGGMRDLKGLVYSGRFLSLVLTKNKLFWDFAFKELQCTQQPKLSLRKCILFYATKDIWRGSILPHQRSTIYSLPSLPKETEAGLNGLCPPPLC